MRQNGERADMSALNGGGGPGVKQGTRDLNLCDFNGSHLKNVTFLLSRIERLGENRENVSPLILRAAADAYLNRVELMKDHPALFAEMIYQNRLGDRDITGHMHASRPRPGAVNDAFLGLMGRGFGSMREFRMKEPEIFREALHNGSMAKPAVLKQMPDAQEQLPRYVAAEITRSLARLDGDSEEFARNHKGLMKLGFTYGLAHEKEIGPSLHASSPALHGFLSAISPRFTSWAMRDPDLTDAPLDSVFDEKDFSRETGVDIGGSGYDMGGP